MTYTVSTENVETAQDIVDRYNKNRDVSTRIVEIDIESHEFDFNRNRHDYLVNLVFSRRTRTRKHSKLKE